LKGKQERLGCKVWRWCEYATGFPNIGGVLLLSGILVSAAVVADTTSPMLLRYFGSKAGLFEAALIETVRVGDLFKGSRAKFGENLISLFLDTALELKAPSIIALSTGHSDARDIATRVIAERVVDPLAIWLGPPDAQARALQIIMLAMGFVLFTRQFPLVRVGKGVDKKLAKWFAQTLQAIVDQH
jgi:hypothetical protein